MTFETLEERRVLAVVVNTLIDEADGSITDGDISLRDAVANAPDGATIEFSVTGTINLLFGEIPIYQNVTIAGPGTSSLIVNAQSNSRIFMVSDADESSYLDVRLMDISLINGRSIASPGGAIRNEENLSLKNVHFQNNLANGGGIYSTGKPSITVEGCSFVSNSGGINAGEAALTVVDSIFEANATSIGGAIVVNRQGNDSPIQIASTVFRGNSASTNGGGIYHDGSGTVVITGCSFVENEAENGGGVYTADGGALTVESSTFDSNIADGTFGAGGGIWTRNGVLSVKNSLFTNNNSVDRGGGVFVQHITFGRYTEYVNSTFSHNTSGGAGGGIHAISFTPPLISSCTIYANTSGSGAGGVHAADFVSSGAAVTVINSVIASNTANGITPADISGRAATSYSLVTSINGTLIVGPGNILGANPMLGVLADNGGPTFTHFPAAESPLVNSANPAAEQGQNGVPFFDQRGPGFPRIVGGRLDMGAVERTIPSPDFDQDEDIDGADFLLWQRGVGMQSGANREDGDADLDGDVDAEDLTAWESAFGSNEESAAVEIYAESLTAVVASNGHRSSADQLADAAMAWAMLDKQDGEWDGVGAYRGARRCLRPLR